MDEGGGLEIRCTLTCTGGSNPSPSANLNVSPIYALAKRFEKGRISPDKPEISRTAGVLRAGAAGSAD